MSEDILKIQDAEKKAKEMLQKGSIDARKIRTKAKEDADQRGQSQYDQIMQSSQERLNQAKPEAQKAYQSALTAYDNEVAAIGKIYTEKKTTLVKVCLELVQQKITS